MKKPQSKRIDDMRPEHDFASMKGGVRGKHHGRIKQDLRRNRFASRLRGNVVAVILEPDVSEIFHSSESVNRALRSIIAAVPNARKSGRKAS
ncbi:MAG TPA: hypothetical protein VFA60_12010 [Terriglobales bacterium]|nr:hypothetical protein [Terriglobales bacterium]